jgi:hypothetical protein
MGIDLFGYIFGLIVFDEPRTSGMMTGKRSGIKDIIIVNKQNLLILKSILLNLA